MNIIQLNEYKENRKVLSSKKIKAYSELQDQFIKAQEELIYTKDQLIAAYQIINSLTEK